MGSSSPLLVLPLSSLVLLQVNREKEPSLNPSTNQENPKQNNPKAEKWIEENELNIFDLISYCQQREKEEFGEIQTTFNNAETLVNQYAYWRGQELLYLIETIQIFDYEREDDNISDRLIKDVQDELNQKFDLA